MFELPLDLSHTKLPTENKIKNLFSIATFGGCVSGMQKLYTHHDDEMQRSEFKFRAECWTCRRCRLYTFLNIKTCSSLHPAPNQGQQQYEIVNSHFHAKCIAMLSGEDCLVVEIQHSEFFRVCTQVRRYDENSRKIFRAVK